MNKQYQMMNRKMIAFLLMVLLSGSGLYAQENLDLTLFNYWQYHSDVENSLYKHFCTTAFDQLKRRKEQVDQLSSKEDWEGRKAFIREKLENIINVPKRTPLNARVTGTLKREGYTIEKILYESRPDYFVTAAIYIPEGLKRKTPAIFYACGHSRTGFRAETYQHIIVNLVKKGFVVFTIDPMGQGERYEYWDQRKGESYYPVPDHEHSYAGAQCLITGYSTGNNFIWDAIRGIDYMLTRKEIDPDRIGMTGRSGGGNITAYLGAIDDRILATAPECYITSYEYLFKSIGPQCAEQNLYGMIAEGLDHPDFLVARAPKPTMVISTTRDFFSIQGTRESFQEARKAFRAFEVDDKLILVEDDSIHKSTKKNREAMYAFFQRELKNPGNSEDMAVDIPSYEELMVTPTGQVVTSFPNSQSVYSINLKEHMVNVSAIQTARKNIESRLKEIPSLAAKYSGFALPEVFGKSIFSGRYNMSGYTLEKYLVTGTGDYLIPILLFQPAKGNRKEVVLIVDSDGMENAVRKREVHKALIKAGYTVLLFDLPGVGSMGPGYLKGDSYIDNTSYNQWFAANLTGLSTVGLRAQDIVRVINFSKEYLKDFGISALSVGPLSGELLHAATFEPLIKNILLIDPLTSYAGIAETKYYDPKLIPFVISGATQAYDLSDLMAGLYQKNLLLANPRSGDNTLAGETECERSLEFALKVFDKKQAGAMDLKYSISKYQMSELVVSWLNKKVGI